MLCVGQLERHMVTLVVAYCETVCGISRSVFYKSRLTVGVIVHVVIPCLTGNALQEGSLITQRHLVYGHGVEGVTVIKDIFHICLTQILRLHVQSTGLIICTQVQRGILCLTSGYDGMLY